MFDGCHRFLITIGTSIINNSSSFWSKQKWLYINSIPYLLHMCIVYLIDATKGHQFRWHPLTTHTFFLMPCTEKELSSQHSKKQVGSLVLNIGLS